MTDQLLVGAAEVDITPSVGTMLAGNLEPRPSIGVEDPLTFKAVVLESGGVKIAYVLMDLLALQRTEGDKLVAAASQRTGIPAENIVWAASHTHTGPYVWPTHQATNQEWLAGLAEKFALAVEKAHASRRPAKMCRERGYYVSLIHNRRFKYKDGRVINTWLLHGGEEEVQCLGTAAPVDPEIGIMSFDDEQGVPIAVLWHYALHTNSNFGPSFSADYPGVVASRLRERFGPGTVPIFMPGAFGDINGAVMNVPPTRKAHRILGDDIAHVIIERLNQRKPKTGKIVLGSRKQEITVPFRDFDVDQEKRIKDSQWSPHCQDLFRKQLEELRQAGVREGKTIIQAWRIGEVGFASVPGELFVEWGLKIKEESPFPWTFPIFLGGDCMGYLVTRKAWEAGGYESLLSHYSRPSVEGVELMVDTAMGLLGNLWKA